MAGHIWSLRWTCLGTFQSGALCALGVSKVMRVLFSLKDFPRGFKLRGYGLENTRSSIAPQVLYSQHCLMGIIQSPDTQSGPLGLFALKQYKAIRPHNQVRLVNSAISACS